MRLRQATCVAIDGRGVMFEGPPGSGKSSLALALIDRGATLVGDDGTQLDVRAGQLWASPPAHTRGRLEMRNVGLVEFPAVSAPVCLLIALDADAPRFVDKARDSDILGCAIPTLVFASHDYSAPIKVEKALQVYGLAQS